MIRSRHLVASALLFFFLTLACENVTPTSAPRPTTLPTSPATAPPAVTATNTVAPVPVLRTFAFGVEYMVPGLAQIYGQTGARSTRPSAETFGWQNIEPTAPRDGEHDYKWDKVDRYITEYQGAGFDQIQIYTTALNNWASSKPGNYFPDAQYLDDYEDYIFNFVERYDRDGNHDMPGLKYPVLDYVIEREWTSYFPGTTDEYLQLLTVAHRAVNRANPNARVWLVPLMMVDVFDHNPSADEIAKRVKVNYSFRHPAGETQKLLTHPELFDVIEIHSLGDYTELDDTMTWLSAEMKKNSYAKPIFIGDGLGISQFFWPMGADFLTFAPIRSNDALRVITLLDAIKDANATDHGAATRWFRAEHAKALVKKFAAAIHNGYAGMNAWAVADIALFQQPRVTGDWFFMGMIEAQPGLVTWTPGAPRPAYYALKQTIEHVKDFSSVEKLNTGSSVVAYRFTVRGKPVLVAWNEPGRIYFPGETEPSVKINLPINAARATVTYTITQIGVNTPRIEKMAASNNLLALTLDSTPVFIAPE